MSKRNIIIGAVVVVVALAAVGSMSGGGTDAPTATVAPGATPAAIVATEAPTQAPADGPIVAEEGVPVTIEGIELTVEDSSYWRGDDIQKPAKGYVYVAIKVNVKALETSQFSSSGDWTALSDGNKQGDWAIVIKDEWEPTMGFDELRAGASQSGWVTFEVPEPEEYVELVYDPSFFSDEAKLVYRAKCCGD